MNCYRKYKKIGFTLLLAGGMFLSGATLYAQGPSIPTEPPSGNNDNGNGTFDLPDPCTSPDVPCPIDGGLSLLIAAGVGIGARKAYKRKKEQQVIA